MKSTQEMKLTDLHRPDTSRSKSGAFDELHIESNDTVKLTYPRLTICCSAGVNGVGAIMETQNKNSRGVLTCRRLAKQDAFIG